MSEGYASTFPQTFNRRNPKKVCNAFGVTTERLGWPPELASIPDWHFVRCGTIDLDALARDHDQFWAKVLVRYEAREQDDQSVPRLA